MFRKAIERIIRDEGGYVNDSTDLGGETKYGISKRSFPDLDIKNLTVEEAINIYERLYWIPSKAEKLPKEIQEVYFELVVNAGQGNAVKILQRACNSKLKPKLEVDGKIGAMTIGQAQKLSRKRFIAYQTLYYADIVFRKPEQERFWFGWFNRAVDDLQEGE